MTALVARRTRSSCAQAGDAKRRLPLPASSAATCICWLLVTTRPKLRSRRRRYRGVSKVLLADAPQFANGLAEAVAAQVVALAGDYSHILAAASAYGKNIMPRVAALLDVAQVSEIVSIETPDTFVRPIYAGNAMATVQATDAIKVITVRPTSFEAAPAEGGSAGVENVAAVDGSDSARFVSRDIAKSDRPELQGAKVVISGGRGIGSADNFKLLEPLADRLNAAIGASRAAVDAGYAPNDWQVGQTGKVVAPQLVHRGRDLRRDPAPGRHEGFEGDRCDQQGRGGADLPGGRLRAGGRSVRGRAAAGEGTRLTTYRSAGAPMSYVAPVKDMLFVLNELAGLKRRSGAAGLRGRDRRNSRRGARGKRAFHERSRRAAQSRR
jgi:electron transfer flavoprotein alpha subunit